MTETQSDLGQLLATQVSVALLVSSLRRRITLDRLEFNKTVMRTLKDTPTLAPEKKPIRLSELLTKIGDETR